MGNALKELERRVVIIQRVSSILSVPGIFVEQETKGTPLGINLNNFINLPELAPVMSPHHTHQAM